MKENVVTIGIDIGGTNLKAVALEKPEKIIYELERPSGAQISPEKVKEAIVDTVNFFKNNYVQPKAIGIGCAGSVSPYGTVRNSPNFKNWKDIPLKDWIEKEFPEYPVAVDNDANCAAYTEWKIGVGKGLSNVIVLTIGTGIGGGIIIENKLYKGSTGTAGEIGHLSIHSNGRKCACGNIGCFERYCSASALEKKIKPRTVKEFFEGKKNSKDLALMDSFINDFKIALTSLANIFDPDMIILVGGVSLGLIGHIEEIRAWLRNHCFPAVAAHVRLDFGTHTTLSGALGAALIAMDLL